MANNEMLWRKLPIGIIRDEDMDLIADQLPPELRAAPYMFYLTALCKADNDGIFDLEDGVIFARLMRIGSPADVFTIANLMLKRKIILRAGETSRCMLAAWDYPMKDKPRTLEERRQIVAKQIEAEKRVTAGSSFNSVSDPVTAPEQPLFFMPENDKNTENVVNNIYDDKNQKNVVIKNQTEREKERETRLEIQRIETHTETEDKRETETLALRAYGEALHSSTGDYTAETAEQTKPEGQENNSLAPAETTGITEHGELSTQVYSILTDFFTKNNLGFNKELYSGELLALQERMKALADNRNPPEIVAAVFLGQYKRMSEEDPHWKNTPLTPEYLLKPGIYSHVLQATSKILLTDKTSGSWIAQQRRYEAEAMAEKSVVGDGIDESYVQYGIDPKDPNRAIKLMQAKTNIQRGTTPP